MNEKKVTLAEIDIDVTEVNDQLVALQKEINTISESQKAMRKNGQTATKAYQDQSIQLKDLKKQYRDTQKVAMGLNAIQSKEINTVAEARKAVAALNVRWANTTKLYGKNSKKSTLMQEQLNKTRGRLKELEEQAGNTAPAVGGYKDAIQQSIGAMGGMNPVLAKTTMSFKTLGAVLKAHPIIFIVTAIVAALGALVKAFKSTDEGATKFASILNQVEAALDVLRNKLIDVGNIIRDVFKGEKTIREAGRAIADTFEDMGGQIKAAATEADKFTIALDKLGDAENNWISRQAEIRNAQAKARYTAEDRDADIRERRAATEEYISLLMEEVAQTKDFAKQRLDIETEKLAAMAGVDAKQILRYVRMSDAERENADASLNEMRNRYEGQVNELEKLYAAYIDADTQYYEKAKKSLSKRAELANQEREILKGRIEADREFYEALMETVNMDLLSISQKETAALNTLRIDEELTEQTREQAKARVEMAKWEAEQVRIAQEAKMMFMGDALGGMAELFGRETALGKSAAIAQATINAYLAGSQVLSDATLPTVAKVAGMVAVITSGMANVRNIMKVDTSGGSVGAVATGGGSVIGTAPTTTAALNNYAGIVTANTANSTAGASNIVGGISDTVNKRETVLVLEDYQLVESRANRIKVESTI